MRGRPHGVAGERGQRGGVDALAADVADRDAPGAVAERERVVEVAADLDAPGRRPPAGRRGRARARREARAAAATPAASARPCARARRAGRAPARPPSGRRAPEQVALVGVELDAAREGERQHAERAARRRSAAAPHTRPRAGTACRPAREARQQRGLVGDEDALLRCARRRAAGIGSVERDAVPSGRAPPREPVVGDDLAAAGARRRSISSDGRARCRAPGRACSTPRAPRRGR